MFEDGAEGGEEGNEEVEGGEEVGVDFVRSAACFIHLMLRYRGGVSSVVVEGAVEEEEEADGEVDD